MTNQLQDLMLNDRGFAFDPTSGETFQLSTTGLRIVRLLQEGHGHETILEHVIEESEVEPNTATRDLADLLLSLKQVGWISE